LSVWVGVGFLERGEAEDGLETTETPRKTAQDDWNTYCELVFERKEDSLKQERDLVRGEKWNTNSSGCLFDLGRRVSKLMMHLNWMTHL